jgi:hypothetical protein
MSIQSWRRTYWTLLSTVKTSSKVSGNTQPPVTPLARHVPLGRTNWNCIACVRTDWAMSQQWKGQCPSKHSGSYRCFNAKKICTLPTECICVSWDFQNIQRFFISLNSINHFCFFLCEIQTEFFYIVKTNFILQTVNEFCSFSGICTKTSVREKTLIIMSSVVFWL